MSITAKHLATFLMGAAAGAAIMKYNNMSKEEQEALVNNLKTKADDLKTEAEGAISNLQVYFEDLKGKGMDALKTHMGEAEHLVNEFINPKKDTGSTTA
jgi:gas vesicle protein